MVGPQDWLARHASKAHVNLSDGSTAWNNPGEQVPNVRSSSSFSCQLGQTIADG